MANHINTKNFGIPNFAIVMDRLRRKYRSIYEVGKTYSDFQQRKIDMETGVPGEWENS